MYITIDVDKCEFDDSLSDIFIYKHRGRYMEQIALLAGVPKYQALAMQNALKAANPEDYKHSNTVIKLVSANVTASALIEESLA